MYKTNICLILLVLLARVTLQLELLNFNMNCLEDFVLESTTLHYILLHYYLLIKN